MSKYNVGLIGFGGIGHVHAAEYLTNPQTRLTAIADIDESKLKGGALNINLGTGTAIDISNLNTYASAEEMLAAEQLDIVDVCVPTDQHADCAIKALAAGCHVLCEKPMARTLEQADAMIAAARSADRKLMIGQCLRFWPVYETLLEAVHDCRYGKLLFLSMCRISGLPNWSGGSSWFMDGKRSGGALLDLHIHDTDFTHVLLGMPEAVLTCGSTFASGAIDNAVTQYIYRDGPPVTAETSWCYNGNFMMTFRAIFEEATLELQDNGSRLVLLQHGSEPQNMKLPGGTGFGREIAYFVQQLATGGELERCTPFSTRETLRIALAEEASALTHKPVTL
jgi:predicted dehydrogenase